MAASEPPDGGFKAGAPLEPGTSVADEGGVIEALKTCFDPEIPVDIYELGLIYGFEIKANGDVHIDMTLPTPHCPVAGTLPLQAAHAVANVAGIGEVTLELTWDPPWTPDLMSADAQLVLGMF